MVLAIINACCAKILAISILIMEVVCFHALQLALTLKLTRWSMVLFVIQETDAWNPAQKAPMLTPLNPCFTTALFLASLAFQVASPAPQIDLSLAKYAHPSLLT